MDWNTITSWIWLLGIGTLAYWMMRRGGCGMGHSYAGGPGSGTAEHHARMTGPSGAGSDSPPVVHDPVCGMAIDPGHAAGQRTIENRTFHFCSRKCLGEFDEDPKRFDSRAEPAASERHAGHRGQGGCC